MRSAIAPHVVDAVGHVRGGQPDVVIDLEQLEAGVA